MLFPVSGTTFYFVWNKINGSIPFAGSYSINHNQYNFVFRLSDRP